MVEEALHEPLHRVTIRCADNVAALLHELRTLAPGHIRGDLRVLLNGGERVISMMVDDVELVRQAVRDHCPEGTPVHVEIPEQRAP